MDNHVKQEIQPTTTTTTSPAGFTQQGETVTLIDLCSSDDSDVEENVNGLEDVESADRRRFNSGNPVGAKRARDALEVERNNAKKATVDELAVRLPEGFCQSLPPEDVTYAFPAAPCSFFVPNSSPQPYSGMSGRTGSCKQFWKAGDYEGAPGGYWDLSSGKPKADRNIWKHSWEC